MQRVHERSRRWRAVGVLVLGILHGRVLRAAPIPGTNCDDQPDGAAITCEGILLPEGMLSFADTVLTYQPLYSGGPAPTDPMALDPTTALGAPNYAGGDIQDVALGRGGLLALGFADNSLTTSGDTTPDLHIFEIGTDVEDTFVALHPTPSTLARLGPELDVDGDGFLEIGRVSGATSSIDIDDIFPGFGAGALRFDALQFLDDPDEGDSSGATVGADIDAVGALESTASIQGCTDSDNDGEPDGTDRCLDTPPGSAVDDAGCSLSQFCGLVDATTKRGKRTCRKSDWVNDEPLMKAKQADCRVEIREDGVADDVCAPR